MFATGVTMVGLAEWIIDDTCLVKFKFAVKINLKIRTKLRLIMLHSTF